VFESAKELVRPSHCKKCRIRNQLKDNFFCNSHNYVSLHVQIVSLRDYFTCTIKTLKVTSVKILKCEFLLN
jgi:hypothetical protein